MELEGSPSLAAAAEPWLLLPQRLVLAADSVPLSNSSSFLCTDACGWRVAYGYTLTRCFFQGVVMQVPSILAFTVVTAILCQIRSRKQLTSTPPQSVSLQRKRLALQLTLTAVLAALYGAEAISIFGPDISSIGPLVSIASLVPVTMLTYVEILKTTKPNGSLLFYWLVSSIVQLVNLAEPYTQRPPHGLEVAVSAVTVAIFFLEWIQPRRIRSDDRFKNPYDEADIFSRLTFSWMTSLMRRGYEHFLTADDLPQLPNENRADICNEEFERNWAREVERAASHTGADGKPAAKPSLAKALLRTFGLKYGIGGIFKMCQDMLAFAQPQLLKLLIGFVQDYSNSGGTMPLTRGFYIALAMFLVSAVQTIVLHQYFDRAFGTGMRIRTAVTNAIFKKSLVLSGEARATRTTGDTVNLMSIDTQRLQDVCQNGNMIWSGPFQIILCLSSLYSLMGNSMWAGVIVLILLVPVNSYLASTQKVLQQQQMRDKDKRTRLTSELLASMKSVKLYAWEDAFVDRLNRVRNEQELVSLRKIGVFQASMSYIWTFTPFIVSCSTFGVYTFIAKKPLTTDIVFPALALFNMLGFPMAVFPMLISGLIEANVASKRIINYLVGEELQPDAVTRLPKAKKAGDAAVEMKNGRFVYTESAVQNGPYALDDVTFEAKRGELSCIVGRVGSGKSTLLLSLLGDIRKASGDVKVHGSVAYVAQNPWIFNGSVRDNILFGRKYDEETYSETIDACALRDDLAVLPDGDSTIVGEKGISLSGGQKARISLARAVFHRADVYLLDDPLSAVDEHVGAHIIANVLGKNGLLASKAIVLATNSIPVLSHADEVSLIEHGKIVETGVHNPRISALLKEFGRRPRDDAEAKEDSASNTDFSPQQSSETALDSGDEDESPQAIVNPAPGRASRRDSAYRPSFASLKPTVPLEVRKEHVEQGKVSWSVYKEYAEVCGVPRVVIFFATLLIAVALSVASNVWLKRWGEANGETGGNANVAFYLGIYAILGVLSSSLTVVQNIVASVWINIVAARQLHEKMVGAVVRAPMTFFETNPLGRIVNRFSSDVYRVDQQLNRVFVMLFNNCVRVGFTIVIICYSTPTFLVFVLPLTWLYLYYQRYYLRTSRELKRLDSVSRSPIFAQFQETLDGIATVRAFDATERFNYRNRSFIDTNNQAFYPSISANRWLAVRLELIGSVVIFAASSLAVWALPSGRLTAGVIGLALSYALQVTQSLNWIVRMTVEVETNIVSVERMMEYAQLKPEAPAIIRDHRPSEDWPTNGHITLDNYSTRYRPELPLVLKNIKLDFKPGEKIGIVGRTGAGKSSLTLALFRLIEATEGHIDIDSINTSSIGLKDLRSNLSIIPQDSQLFEGSVRDNLDPTHKKSDTELWRSLELSHLKDHVAVMDGQLDAIVAEGGGNLSSGQRQLLSLARALLTDSKVLVMDEATAAVDVETDQVLQKVIRAEFKDRTILTIAHRINTILDSDRVVVLSFGEVAEFDSPSELLKREDSQFHALCKRGGVI